MPGNKYLLDTNIVIEIFSGKMGIADKVNELSEFYLSSIVLGELYIGVNRVSNKLKHLKMLNKFLKLCTVLDADSVTASHYGEIMAELYKKGKPIPTNDVWIASIAQQHQCILVTKDKHFKEIASINIKSW